MACVAVSHPFIDDYHPFSGHRFTLSLYTNITCSTHPTSIHNLPTNEQTHLRSEESLLGDRQPRPHCTGDVVTMDRFSGDLLPAMAGLTWFHDLPLVWCRAQPCGQIFPSRWHKPSHRQEIHRGAQTRQMEMRIRVVEAPQNLVGHSRMPLLHHLQTVSPTCPVSCSGQQTGTSKTQTSEGQRQTCHGLVAPSAFRLQSHHHETAVEEFGVLVVDLSLQQDGTTSSATPG